MMAMMRRKKATQHDPAEHCCKNEPKLRVNNSVASHVTLHGRPWVVNFQPLRKLPGTSLMRCRRVGAPNGGKRDRGKRRCSGKRKDLAGPGSSREPSHTAFVRKSGHTLPQRIGSETTLPA
jgi:hypothetical protein